MGNSIANSMAEKQKELQQEMQKKQIETQIRMQERMRRTMIAQQMALARDMVQWIGGFYSFLLLGVTGYTIRHKKFPKVAAIPLVTLGTVLAYQADFAYGNKIQRVDRMMREDILTDKSYWFVPIDPSASDNKDEESQGLDKGQKSIL